MAKRGVYVRSQSELGYVFGVTVQGIGKWIDNGAPTKTDRGYDLRAWVVWWAKRNEPEGGQDAAESDRQFKAARAARETLKLGRERGELIEKLIADREQLALTKMFVGIIERAVMELPSLLWGKKKTRRAMSAVVEDWCNARRVELVGDDAGGDR